MHGLINSSLRASQAHGLYGLSQKMVPLHDGKQLTDCVSDVQEIILMSKQYVQVTDECGQWIMTDKMNVLTISLPVPLPFPADNQMTCSCVVFTKHCHSLLTHLNC